MSTDRVTITPDQATLLHRHGDDAAAVFLAADPFAHVVSSAVDRWDGDTSSNRPPSGVVGPRKRRARLDWLTVAAVAAHARAEHPAEVEHLADTLHAFRCAYGAALTARRVLRRADAEAAPAAAAELRAADVACAAASVRMLDALRECIRPSVRAPRGYEVSPAGTGASALVLYPVGIRPDDEQAVTDEACAIVRAERVQERPAPVDQPEHDEPESLAAKAERVAVEVSRGSLGRPDLARAIRDAVTVRAFDRLPALVEEARRAMRYEARRAEHVAADRERREPLALVPLADAVTMLTAEAPAPRPAPEPVALVLPGLDHLTPARPARRTPRRTAQPVEQLALI